MTTFRSSDFLRRHFVDREAMRAMLGAYGFEQPLANTADKWWRKGFIPSSWLPTLLGVLELEHGQPVSILPFLDR